MARRCGYPARQPAAPAEPLSSFEYGDAVNLCGFRGAGCQRGCKEFAVIGNPAEVEHFDINRVMTWIVVFANCERTWDGLVANGANHGTFFLVTDTLVKLIGDAPAARAGRAPTEKGKTKWK